MGSKVNPTVIGAFVVGAVVFVVAGVLLFGGGKFFTVKVPFVLYFDGSVYGLNVGAPVIFRGVQAGQVTQIMALYDPTAVTLRTKVVFEYVRGSLGIYGQIPKGKDLHQAMEDLIQKGMRASLQMQSFVTGLLYVSLDFHPGTPITRLGLDPTYPEIPTVPSEMDQLMSSLQQALGELGKLPLEALLGKLLEVFQHADTLLTLPEVTHALVSLDEVMTAARHLLLNTDGQVGPLGAKLAGAADTANKTLETARTTLLDAQKMVRNVDGQVTPLASSAKDTLAVSRGTLEQAQKSLKTLTDGATPVLKQAEKTFAGATTLTGSAEGTLHNDLAQTLKALEEAARSVRLLAETLQRHPESLLQGKK